MDIIFYELFIYDKVDHRRPPEHHQLLLLRPGEFQPTESGRHRQQFDPPEPKAGRREVPICQG